ncbi:MAG: hypothetical protein H6619_03225 [Deltaproteobacteria bacterium]|nr:hypothetical protein [Deltaproteobacteria bacterium]
MSPEMVEDVSAVPVLKLSLPPSDAGNAVVIGDQTIITVAHTTAGDERAYLLNNQLAEFRTIKFGGGAERFQTDWRIAEVSQVDLSSYKPIKVAEERPPVGRVIFAVGYWTAPEQRTDLDKRELVVVRGKVVDPPSSLKNEAAGLICVDLGRPSEDWKGLSGGAIVQHGENGLELVGILGGTLSFREWPFIKANCVIPIPTQEER